MITMRVLGNGWRVVWVHTKCYVRDNADFAVCLRCNNAIHVEAEATPATFGRSHGYIHLTCAKHRKLSDDHDDDSDDNCGKLFDKRSDGGDKHSDGDDSQSSNVAF